MKTLPTFNVSDDTLYARIIAAFPDEAGYKAWLKAQIIQQVQTHETQQIYDDYLNNRSNTLDQISTDLNVLA